MAPFAAPIRTDHGLSRSVGSPSFLTSVFFVPRVTSLTLNGLLRPLVQKTYGPEKIDPRNPPKRVLLGVFLSGQNHVSWLANPAEPLPGVRKCHFTPKKGGKITQKGDFRGSKGILPPKLGVDPQKRGVTPKNGGKRPPKTPYFGTSKGVPLDVTFFMQGFMRKIGFDRPYFSPAPWTR